MRCDIINRNTNFNKTNNCISAFFRNLLITLKKYMHFNICLKSNLNYWDVLLMINCRSISITHYDYCLFIYFLKFLVNILNKLYNLCLNVVLCPNVVESIFLYSYQ